MKVRLRTALTLAAGAVWFAGCGGSQTPSIGDRLVNGRGAKPAGPSSSDLLYASSPGGQVYVLLYPQGTLVNTLDLYDDPAGLCSDRSGNVYIAYPLDFVVVEYAHGGSEPVKTLADPEQEPYGCAVDPSSGNLAVTSAAGSIQVFKKGGGTPQTYKLSGVEVFSFCTYDDAGDLFADGITESGDFALVELAKHNKFLNSISVNATIDPYYAIQWQGKDLAIQASQGSGEAIIDRVRIANFSGSVVGTTTLDLSADKSSAQFWIYNARIVEPEAGDVGLWKYPSGGEAIKAFGGLGSDGLIGVTISVGKPH